MLTDTAIKTLKPKDKLYKIVDRDGMYVVVQPSGSIVFRLDYRLNGRRETLTLGRYGPAGVAGWAIKSVARRPLKMLLAVALEPLLSRAANKLAQRYKR